ncbi:hypothetical protein N9W89_08320 [Hellea sp.]|nr:hypothetical protein [Hellea sp.]
MDSLAKICEVMALKRSRAEREITQSKKRLLALDNQLQALTEKISGLCTQVSSGVISDDPIGDAIILEQWRDITLGNMQKIQAQQKDIRAQLDMEKQMLKEILVKEDILKTDMKVKRRAHEQDLLEGESSARLENWIVSQSCSQ